MRRAEPGIDRTDRDNYPSSLGAFASEFPDLFEDSAESLPTFSGDADLTEALVKNWSKIRSFGAWILQSALYVQSHDICAHSADGDAVLTIHVESGVADLRSLAMVLKKMGAVRKNTGQDVRGIIIGSCVSHDLKDALVVVENVTFENYLDFEM